MRIDNIIEMVIPAIITGVGGWFMARKRNSADTKRVEIDNADRLAEVWQKSADSMSQQISELLILVEQLRKENLNLKETVYNLQTEVTELKSQIKKYA